MEPTESILSVETPLGESEHDKEAIAIAEGKIPEKKESGLLAGKYKNAGELEKAYKELEKKLGSAKQQTSDTSNNVANDTVNDNEPDNIDNTPEDDGDDNNNVEDVTSEEFQAYSDEYFETGTLSEGTYKALQDKGIPKAYVDQYIEGVKLLQEQKTNDVLSLVGGKEVYSEMIQWAEKNLSPEEIEEYNDAVNSGKETRVKQAIKALHVDYTKTLAPTKPKLVKGSGVTTVNAVGYTSKKEMLTDMQSVQYKSDPAFREKVSKKLALTNF